MKGNQSNQTDRTQVATGPAAQNRRPANTDDLVTLVRKQVAGKLTIVDGPGQGNVLEVMEGTNSIGRNPDVNVIVLNFGDSFVHREHHAFLTIKAGHITLHDNGKQNAVLLNGRAVQGEVTVKSGDTITIGRTQLRFVLS